MLAFKKFETVFIISSSPPKTYASLILRFPWPGISTRVSLGIDKRATLFSTGFRCKTIMVSALPISVSVSLVSLPRIRTVTGD